MYLCVNDQCFTIISNTLKGTKHFLKIENPLRTTKPRNKSLKLIFLLLQGVPLTPQSMADADSSRNTLYINIKQVLCTGSVGLCGGWGP